MAQNETLETLSLIAEDLARFRRDASEVRDVNLRRIYEQLAGHLQWVMASLAERPGFIPDQAPWWPQFRDGTRRSADPDVSA